MSRTKILFLAADPHSAPDYGAARLQLDEELARIQRAIRSARFGHLVDVEIRLAARTDDLLDALIETDPDVVHFSGHGRPDGLVMVSSDGNHPHVVPAAALMELFRQFPGKIKLVFLNACFSLPQAQAIADRVGCAVGTSGAILDTASVQFAPRFYWAIADGRTVQTAYDAARVKLLLEDHAAADCPRLVARPDVDASDLILVPAQPAETERDPGPGPIPRRKWVVATMTAGLAVGAAVVTPTLLPKGNHPAISLGDACQSSSPATSAARGSSELDAAKRLLGAGRSDEAFAHMKRAADAKNPEALVILGRAYLRGDGTKPDTTLGMSLLHDGAKTHDLCAMKAFAAASLTTPQIDVRGARTWFRKAAEDGDPGAMRDLARTYTDGEPYDSAIAWLRKAIAAHSNEARVDLGAMYERGHGVLRDPSTAASLYRMAADSGSLRGMVQMGRVYQMGVGRTRDFAQAREWYHKAADGGFGDGMRGIGGLYEKGQGVEQDCGEALRWYRAARDAGSADAAADLSAASGRCSLLRVLYRRMFPLSSLPRENQSVRQAPAV